VISEKLVFGAFLEKRILECDIENYFRKRKILIEKKKNGSRKVQFYVDYVEIITVD
jgi:hypothetical protein